MVVVEFWGGGGEEFDEQDAFGAKLGEDGWEEGEEFDCLLGDALVDNLGTRGEWERNAETTRWDTEGVDDCEPRRVLEERCWVRVVVERSQFVAVWRDDVDERGGVECWIGCRKYAEWFGCWHRLEDGRRGGVAGSA